MVRSLLTSRHAIDEASSVTKNSESSVRYVKPDGEKKPVAADGDASTPTEGGGVGEVMGAHVLPHALP